MYNCSQIAIRREVLCISSSAALRTMVVTCDTQGSGQSGLVGNWERDKIVARRAANRRVNGFGVIALPSLPSFLSQLGSFHLKRVGGFPSKRFSTAYKLQKGYFPRYAHLQFDISLNTVYGVMGLGLTMVRLGMERGHP